MLHIFQGLLRVRVCIGYWYNSIYCVASSSLHHPSFLILSFYWCVWICFIGPPPEPTNLEVSHVTNTSSNFSIAPCTMLLNWTTPVSNAGGVNATFDLHLVDLRTQAAGDVRGIVGTTWYTLSSAELEAVLLIGGDGVGGLCGGEGEGGEGEGGGGGGGGAEGDGCRWFGVSVTAVNDAGASPSSDKVNFTFPSGEHVYSLYELLLFVIAFFIYFFVILKVKYKCIGGNIWKFY